ncbi:MAG: 50S ribosomal protein L33 [Planctomycetes bacterium]|nr:50S ribosomal protein L33 [Planctomycetota bacterium]
MAKKDKEARGYIWLKCEETGDLNYRTQKRLKGETKKLRLKKYSPRLRRATWHVESKKG